MKCAVSYTCFGKCTRGNSGGLWVYIICKFLLQRRGSRGIRPRAGETERERERSRSCSRCRGRGWCGWRTGMSAGEERRLRLWKWLGPGCEDGGGRAFWGGCDAWDAFSSICEAIEGESINPSSSMSFISVRVKSMPIKRQVIQYALCSIKAYKMCYAINCI